MQRPLDPEAVTFDDLVDAFYDQWRVAGTPPSTPDFGEVRKVFQERNGRLDRIAYGYWNGAAVALAIKASSAGGIKPLLFSRRPRGLTAQVAELLFTADQISIEARRRLRDESLQYCLEMVYSAVEYVIRLVDLPEGAKQPDVREGIEAVKRQLDAARNYADRSVARSAVLGYLAGMGFAVIALVALGLIATQLVGIVKFLPIPTDPVLVASCLVAGGLGAVLSVMLRITKGDLAPVGDVSRLQTLVTGSFRPLIGLISGVLIYFIVSSSLIPLQVPTAAGPQWNFFVTLAFIAGFSERLIQDAIVRTENVVSGGGSSKAKASLPGT